MQNIVIIMGGPGSGKGTIAELLLNSHKFNYIETGALFRSLVNNPEIVQIMASGKLVPDEKLFPIIAERIISDEDILFDGFPRNIAQAKWLIDKFQNNMISVVYLKLSTDIMIQRIYKRLSEGSVRVDDAKKEIISKRLSTFENETLPAIEFLSTVPNVDFLEIDASITPNEIAQIASFHLDLLNQA
jgi:adenylate kinase